MYYELQTAGSGPVPRRVWQSLRFIASHPDTSSRQVADGIGVRDPAQMSRLGRRLLELGLAEQGGRSPHAWSLTAEGERAIGLLQRNPVATIAQLQVALEVGDWPLRPRPQWQQ